MRTWPALLASPLLVLGDQSVAYALAGWGCAHQNHGALHAVHAAFLLATLVILAISWRESRQALRRLRSDGGFTLERIDFMDVMATMVGLLSAATIAAMWFPQWFLSPCYG
ncbi:MAG TPA: hypothetical protein VM122_11550 [Usitatibacter sp.]|nr:hypothetical protein [Usitatibacter sp.]